jgi:hypothetical protein
MKPLSAILTISALLLASMAVDAKKVKTTHRQSSSKRPSTAVVIAQDTLCGPDIDVALSGYEKPLRANRESVFITNNTARDIIAIALTTVYYDTSDRAIHSSTRHIDVDAPAGSTRRLYYPSWDSQHTFYYIGSQKPQRALATPYDVRQRVDTIFVTPLTDAPSY